MYALFIDLVKAFDSINHEILYALLDKFGVPKDLMKTIQKMYSDCTIHLQVGKEERESEYGTGVKQGDNMAPILSLFIMQAAYKMLQKRLTCEPFNFRHFPDNTKNPQNQNGCFASQNTSSNGKTFSVNSSFYVDDGIFLLATQHEAEQTAQLIYDHLDHFGLQMHVGSPKQRSETEAMFFPSTLAQAKQQTKSEKPNIMLNENKNNIHFTSSFKYLGAFLMPDLTEDAKIEAQINKASSQLGMLKHIFNCKDVDRCVKFWVSSLLHLTHYYGALNLGI